MKIDSDLWPYSNQWSSNHATPLTLHPESTLWQSACTSHTEGTNLKYYKSLPMPSSQWHAHKNTQNRIFRKSRLWSIIDRLKILTPHREKESNITLPHAHTEQARVSFLSGSTFKTQRCHKWLQTGWKKRWRDGRERVMHSIMSSCDTAFLWHLLLFQKINSNCYWHEH